MSDRRTRAQRRWVGAHATAQMLAAAVHLVQAGLLGRVAASGVALPPVGHAFLAVVAGAVEGLILGVVASAAMRWNGRRRGRFVAATTLAMGTAWLAGVLASFLEPGAPLSPALRLSVAAGAGVLLGTLVGGAQWGALRYGPGPSLRLEFVVASAAGWGAGLVLGSLAAAQVPWGPTSLVGVAWTLGGAGATGLAAASVTAPWVHGRWDDSPRSSRSEAS